MKKFLLSMFCALGLLSANATTVTFTPKDQGYENSQVIETATAGEVTFTFAGTGNKAAYYTSGEAIRMYGGNTLKVSVPEGQVITEINFIFDSGETQGKEITANKGKWNDPNWSGKEQSVTFTVSTGSGNRRIASATVSYEAGVGETPDEPETPVTLYTVTEALNLINSGNIPSETVQVKGVISSIDEISTQFGNATYDIKDDLTDTGSLKVYRGYYIDGNRFSSTDQLAVGGIVVVEGTLSLYQGNTPEVNQGNKVISYTAPEGGGDNPGGETPEVPDGDEVQAAFYATATYSGSAEYSAQIVNNSDGNLVTPGTDFSAGDITISFTQKNSNATNVNSNLVRWYKNDILNIEPLNNATITKVEVLSSGTYTSAPTANVGTVSGDGTTTFTWTGATNSTLTLTAAAAQIRFSLITISYVPGEAATVATPKISCEDNTVTITCATEGAEIFYSMDGSTPSNASATSYRYTGPVSIEKTVTVKAIAYKGSDASSVATFTANHIGTFDGFAAYIEANPTAGGTVNGPITTIYQNGIYLYLKDNMDGFMLAYGDFSGMPTDFKNGDRISFISGTYSPFAGLPEMKPTAIGERSSGTPVEPAELALEELGEDILNAYVKVENVTIAADASDNRKFAINDGTMDEDFVLYNTFQNTITIPEGEGFTILGFVSINNGTMQLTPIEITGGTIMETVATPVIEPVSGAVLSGTQVTITCATEGATIFYTADGSEPTIESGVIYAGAITVDGAMTIKAIAAKEGMITSQVATAVYTIFDPNATQAMFNFTDPASLGLAIPTEENQEVDLSGKVISQNAVTVTVSDKGSSNTNPRLWWSQGAIDLRLYKSQSITLAVPSGYALESMTFTKAAGDFAVDASAGEFNADGNNARWTTAADKTVTSVTFTATATTRIATIDVKYKKLNGEDGVNDIEAAENAPVEYFNLQGVRVVNPTAGQLLIKKQGNTVTKVIF